jgi:tetratricopeptide (TPR) repeat protein
MPRSLRRCRELLLLLALACASVDVAAGKTGPTAPDPAVEDPAGALHPFRPGLARTAAQWRTDLGIEVQIVTQGVRSGDLTRQARRLFRQRGVGESAPAGGLLLLIDVQAGRACIQASPQLGEVFPARLLDDLARHQLAPYAAYGALGMAVADVLHLLKDHAYQRLAAGSLSAPAALRRAPGLPDWLSRRRGPEASVELPPLPDDLELKRRVPEAERARYTPSPLVTESVEAYLRVLDELVGDPSLELFTPGSRVMRARYPVAPYEAWKRRDRLRASRPFELRVQGDRAVVGSNRPAQGFLPVLLQRIDGTWRIDEAETWKNLFYLRDGTYVVENSDNPYMFGLGHLPSHGSHELWPIPLGDEDVEAAVSRLEAELARRPDPQTHFELAEILFRNCFAALSALTHYEAAARLAAEDVAIQRITAERALYLGFAELAIPYLERVEPPAYEALAGAHWRAGHYEDAERLYALALERDPASQEARRGLLRARKALVR